MPQVVIKVEGISKKYLIGGKYHNDTLRDVVADFFSSRVTSLTDWSSESDKEREFWALKNVTFDVRQGEVFGIIGRNGAGKSTLLKILSRITSPTAGQATISGRVTSLLEIGSGFHPELTGRENIFLNGAILGMNRQTIIKKFDEIVSFSELEKFIDTPVKRYSSGMYTRLAFAVAANLDSEILIIDEVLAVGDVIFQKKSLGKMEQVAKAGRTVLLVSHGMASIQRLCHRVLLLDNGEVAKIGTPDTVIKSYLGHDISRRARVEWKSKELAPGDKLVRMKSVAIFDKFGKPSSKINITDSFSIEIQYWVLQPDHRPSAGIYLRTQEGLHLLSSFDFHNPEYGDKHRRVGLYSSVCQFPGNFLANGFYTITPAINYFFPVSGCNADYPDAISFEIVDNNDPNAVRRYVETGWPGIVRPKLPWTITEV